MMKLTVASFLPHLPPPVCLYKNDEFFDLHAKRMA
jgi:hypothetical protein